MSIDGCISGFEADLGAYYSLIDRWHEDATLVGTETILRAMSSDAEEPSAAEDLSPPGQPDTRPLLVVPDSFASGWLTQVGALQLLTAVANLLPFGPMDGANILAAWRSLRI